YGIDEGLSHGVCQHVHVEKQFPLLQPQAGDRDPQCSKPVWIAATSFASHPSADRERQVRQPGRFGERMVSLRVRVGTGRYGEPSHPVDVQRIKEEYGAAATLSAEHRVRLRDGQPLGDDTQRERLPTPTLSHHGYDLLLAGGDGHPVLTTAR